MTNTGNDEWSMWSKHVLRELERLNSCYLTLDEKLSNMNVELAKLKVKSGVWGFAAGAIPVIVTLLVWLVKTTVIGG